MTDIDDQPCTGSGLGDESDAPEGGGSLRDGMAIPLREPCPDCCCTEGEIITKNGQDTVYCAECGKYGGFNATRAETGRPRRSLRTRRKISPSQKARVLLRDRSACVVCNSRGDLVIGHAVSLRDGYAEGMSDAMLYSDHNLVAMCAECNAGLGGASIPPYRLLLIFSLRAHHVVVVADGHGGVFEGRQRVAGVCFESGQRSLCDAVLP